MDTLEQITRKFDRQIEAAEEDGEKLRLRAEKAEAVADYYADQDSKSKATAVEEKRQRLIVQAMVEFPDAIVEQITGETEEEIKESAKVSHEAFLAKVTERSAAQTQQAVEAAAGNAWGGQTAGGATPPPAPAAVELERLHDGLREAYPEGYSGADPLYSDKLKKGDDERLANIALDPNWDAMEAQQVGSRVVKPAPAGATQ